MVIFIPTTKRKIKCSEFNPVVRYLIGKWLSLLQQIFFYGAHGIETFSPLRLASDTVKTKAITSIVITPSALITISPRVIKPPEWLY